MNGAHAMRGLRRGMTTAVRALALLLTLPAAACGAGAPAGGGHGEPGPGRISHDDLDALLARHVRDGLVDYAALKDDPDLDAYLDLLAATDPGTLAGRSEKLAYWINAYNAFVLKGVTDHYPIRSLRDIGAFGRLSFFRSLTFRAGGRDYTLDAIEHRILRNEFREPRIHFAIVCASLGCPRLRRQAFHAPSLDEELTEAARAFIRDPAKVRLDAATATLHLSPIFEWFQEDFDRADGSVIRFLSRYLPEEEASRLQRADITVRYSEYDWTLNDLHPPAPGR